MLIFGNPPMRESSRWCSTLSTIGRRSEAYRRTLQIQGSLFRNC